MGNWSRHLLMPALVAVLTAVARPQFASAKVSDTRLAFVPVPLAKVRVTGDLDDRMKRTAKYLQGLPKDYLFTPFDRRAGQVSNGQFLADWIAYLSDYAACHGDAELTKKVGGYVAALIALRKKDGFIGLDPKEMWDGWVANRLVTALLRVADNTADLKAQTAAVGLAKSLAGRFPPENATAEQSVVGRCVLEALCQAYDVSREYELIQGARDLAKRDSTHLLDYLTERKRLGYAASGPALGDQSTEVIAYLNALLAYHGVSAGAEALPAVQDAWSDINAHHRYVTGGVPALFDWRQGTKPDAADDTAGTGQWLLLNLALWHATGQVEYIDMVERILTNHLPFAQNADGQFTSNNNLYDRSGQPDLAATGLAARAMAQALTAICSVRRGRASGEVYVNLYVPSTVELKLGYADTVTVAQTTAFPADGRVAITIGLAREAEFPLFLRVPSWCGTHAIRINGAGFQGKIEKGYVRVLRKWQPNDKIDLDLTMDFRVERRSGAAPGTGQVSLWYGPVALCVDAQFNGGLKGTFQFVSAAGREAELFAAVPPATVGRPAGPFPIRLAAAGKAMSAGREAILYLTPFANVARGPDTWWRVWLTVYEPRSSPLP